MRRYQGHEAVSTSRNITPTCRWRRVWCQTRYFSPRGQELLFPKRAMETSGTHNAIKIAAAPELCVKSLR